MKRKIAVAVDGSVNCECALRYVVNLSGVIPGLQYVLLHVQPPLSQYLTDEAERKPKALKALRKLIKENESASMNILERAQRHMVQNGIPTDDIELCSRVRYGGVAEDLLVLCQDRSFDALAIGRRGVTRLQELLTGSVTTNLIEHARVTPLWIVDGEVPNTDILLAADGSANALRALDHLSFMIGAASKSKIHLLHVEPRLQDFCAIDTDSGTIAVAEEILFEEDQRCIEGFREKAVAIMQKNGLDQGSLEIETVKTQFSVARAIREAATKGKYGTIVVGRRGLTKGMFTGSVSRSVIQKASNTAVWLVP